jgi:heme exporter protein A
MLTGRVVRSGDRDVGFEAVVARGLWKRFGSTIALRGLSARFGAGTITVIVGPNGAGKSTLMSILAGLGRPSRGSVRYEPFGEGSEQVRGRVGWVGHESHCYPALSVRENVELAARMHGVDPEAGWERVAVRFDLAALARRRCGTLSRGQLQRAALGRGLVHGPALVLLDEPWTGLDAASAKRLDRVVCEERERGAVVVVISHEAGTAERLGATRLRLERGAVVNEGAA